MVNALQQRTNAHLRSWGRFDMILQVMPPSAPAKLKHPDWADRGSTLGRSSSDFGREHLRSLGRRLRELREARSWSLKRLSAESRVSVAAIQKIESGETNPNLLTVLVRGTLPARPLGSISLPSLDRPRVQSRLIALAGRASLEHAEIPRDGALFAYVLDGALQLHFSDGTTEQLGTGDSIHVTEGLPIDWINPLARRSVTLCIADRRGDSAVF
jgi:DNA-binding XRE family transcriptional regulator